VPPTIRPRAPDGLGLSRLKSAVVETVTAWFVVHPGVYGGGPVEVAWPRIDVVQRMNFSQGNSAVHWHLWVIEIRMKLTDVSQ
jgi:hypothetical protein